MTDEILDWLQKRLESYKKVYTTLTLGKRMQAMGKIHIETIESLIEGRKHELAHDKEDSARVTTD